MYIETFVFFDIETTGLPHQERNQTKITELSFVAVSRRDLEITSLGNMPCMSKLSLVFNPQRTIEPVVVKITGLSNNNLCNQPVFKKRIQSINFFLENLTSPVCLVAHNGNIFDYKILRAEYVDAKEELPANIYCVDSLLGFRKILKETNLFYDNLSRSSLIESCEDYLTDDEDEEWPKLNASLEEWQEIDQLANSFSKSTHISNNSQTQCEEKMSKNKQEKACCTLSALYKRLVNKNALEAHRAEKDCLMLLECVIAAKEYFIQWADNACKLIKQIEPLKRK